MNWALLTELVLSVEVSSSQVNLLEAVVHHRVHHGRTDVHHCQTTAETVKHYTVHTSASTITTVQGYYLNSKYYLNGWLGSRVVSVLDSGAVGPGFKSQSRRCRVTVLGKLFTLIVPLFTKQRNW